MTIPTAGTTWRREVLRPPEDFEPDSFRTVRQGAHRAVVAVPRGGRVPEVQAVLHPGGLPRPCPWCGAVKLTRRLRDAVARGLD